MDQNIAFEALFNLIESGNPMVYLVAAVVALAVVRILFGLSSLGRKSRRRKPASLLRMEKKPAQTPRRSKTSPKASYERHLREVSQADFQPKKLMNKGEYTVFATLESHIARNWPKMRVMAQVSLGEIIRPKAASDTRKSEDSDAALWAINAKRVDIAVIDAQGFVVAAVEYQGGGHYRGDAFARDAVKREALRKAGIPYVEIQNGESCKTICAAFDRAINQRGLAAA